MHKFGITCFLHGTDCNQIGPVVNTQGRIKVIIFFV